MSDARKRAIRALAAEMGISYTQAMRLNDAQHVRPQRHAEALDPEHAPALGSPLDVVFMEPGSEASPS